MSSFEGVLPLLPLSPFSPFFLPFFLSFVSFPAFFGGGLGGGGLGGGGLGGGGLGGGGLGGGGLGGGGLGRGGGGGGLRGGGGGEGLRGKGWTARRSTGAKEMRKNAARSRTPAGVAYHCYGTTRTTTRVARTAGEASVAARHGARRERYRGRDLEAHSRGHPLIITTATTSS